jgi:hypothetical protein
MNDYFDWAYSTYYLSTQAQSQSGPTSSQPASERANEAKQIRVPAEPDAGQRRSVH